MKDWLLSKSLVLISLCLRKETYLFLMRFVLRFD